MHTLTVAGTVAGALIAIGTVARWGIRRLIRAGRWTAAAVHLPAVVDDLAVVVTQLSTTVEGLTVAVDVLGHHQHPDLVGDPHAVVSC